MKMLSPADCNRLDLYYLKDYLADFISFKTQGTRLT